MSTQPTFFSSAASASSPPEKSNLRWAVCGLLFLATTINYMDRSVLSLIEPLLHNLPFMGWNFAHDAAHQTAFNNNYGNIVISFQIAYGFGLLTAGRFIDKVGTKIGYAVAITLWAFSSMTHALVFSVTGFLVARFMLGLGESGNFPAAIKAVTEWFPVDERALATGLFNSGSNVSFFVAPALIALVTGEWGWQAGFLATGSMGMLWLILWLLFPYDKLRRRIHPDGADSTQINLVPATPQADTSYANLLRQRSLYAFAIAKGLTDPIWWFYLFYLPKFLNENYGLDLKHAYWEIVTVYLVSSVGSIGGGNLSGWWMRRGHTVNGGRKFALLLTALAVVPIALVPHMDKLFPHNAWPAVLLIALAAAAHQGWSANLFATSSDMFPAAAISTVVGLGGFVGAIGGACFTWIVKQFFALHPLLIFALAASAYLLALAIFQFLVPNLGSTAPPNQRTLDADAPPRSAPPRPA